MGNFKYLFFLLIALYIGTIVFFGLPAVHPWHDPIVVRDTGTVWESLSWSMQGDEDESILAAVMCHIEGPLQFLFLNGYYYLIGDLVPLNPTTTQIPHAVMIFFCAVLFFLIGTRIYSEKFGYLCAAIFVFVPWLPVTARRTEVFSLFSILFELATLYCYLGFILEPERRFYRIAAPVSLAFYLTGSADWPSFLTILFLFLALNKWLGRAVKNPYNLVPVLVMLTYGVVAMAFYVGEMPCNALGMFLKPFERVISGGSSHYVSTTPFLSMLRFSTRAFGPGGVLAIVGVGVYFLSRKIRKWQSPGLAPVQKHFFMSMSVWLVLFSIPLLKFAASLNLETPLEAVLMYAYVLGIPMTIFSALTLVKEKKGFVTVGVLCLMMWMQWYVIITNEQTFHYGYHDRRTLAVATFLIEQRPDLLVEGKLAFFPGDHVRNIGQYARGRNFVFSMSADFPGYLEEKIRENPGRPLGGVGGDIIVSYMTQGVLKINWLVLTPELLQPENNSFEFYRRLYRDPQIHWIACFTDQTGRTVWLGEVKPEGTPIELAEVHAVEPLAEAYEKKYNRISFLKKNVQYILHY